MQRRVTLRADGNAGDVITAQTLPDPGYRWQVIHIAVEVSNYESGPVPADVYVGSSGFPREHFICATRQGYKDTADGSPVEMVPTETFTVTWRPGVQVRPTTRLQCKCTLLVDQRPAGGGAR